MEVRVTALSPEANDFVIYGSSSNIKYEIVFDNKEEANVAAAALGKLIEESKVDEVSS